MADRALAFVVVAVLAWAWANGMLSMSHALDRRGIERIDWRAFVWFPAYRAWADARPAPAERRRAASAARRARRRGGFTLIELVVVLALLGVVAAIVVPHLQGVTGIGNDRQAQESIDSTLSAEVTLEAITGSFSANPSTLAGRLPGTSFVASPTASTSATTVSVAISASGTTVTLASKGTGNDCWILQRDFAAPSGSPTERYVLTHTSSCAPAALPTTLAAPSGTAGSAWSTPEIVAPAGTSGSSTTTTTAGTTG